MGCVRREAQTLIPAGCLREIRQTREKVPGKSAGAVGQDKNTAQIPRFLVGTLDAHDTVVTCVRTRLSAAGILAVVLLTAGAPLVAVVHDVCLAKQHDCGRTPLLIQCCCGDNGDISNQPGVTQAPIDIPGDQSAVSILPYTIEAPRVGASSWRVDTSPPHGRSPDLPILLADLRL